MNNLEERMKQEGYQFKEHNNVVELDNDMLFKFTDSKTDGVPRMRPATNVSPYYKTEVEFKNFKMTLEGKGIRSPHKMKELSLQIAELIEGELM